jgi:hypothetical protein
MPVIPATWEQKSRELWFKESQKKRLASQPTFSAVVHSCNPSYVGDVNRRIMVQVSPAKNVRLFLKNN